LIYKGLETVRTDWTHIAREFQQGLYERVFLKREYQGYIEQVIDGIRGGKYDSKLIYRKRLRRKLSDYQRNVPPHVQAALKAEAWLLKEGRPSRYQHGGWIEYVYTVNGPEPLECLNSGLGSALDYELYLERQIAPIVDGIVTFLGSSYEQITSQQINLL